MLNRLTVSALLKAVIAITSVCVVIALSLTAHEFLGSPQGHQPHLASCGCLRRSVQGDAQSAHRPLDHDAAPQRDGADGPRHREVSPRLARRPDAGDGARPRAVADHRLPTIRHAGAGARAPLQTADGRTEAVLGGRREAQGPAPRGPAEGIYGDDPGPARHARQALEHPGRYREPSGRGDRPAAVDQAERLAAAQHRGRSLADRLDRPQRRKNLAGDPLRLHPICWRHERDVEGAGAVDFGHAAAGGARLGHGGRQNRLFRAAISGSARPPRGYAGQGREARDDGEPMEPAHGRPHGERGRGRGRRARCRQGAYNGAARRRAARADRAAGAAGARHWPRRRRDHAGQPPRHPSAQHHPRCDAQGRRRRSCRRERLS